MGAPKGALTPLWGYVAMETLQNGVPLGLGAPKGALILFMGCPCSRSCSWPWRPPPKWTRGQPGARGCCTVSPSRCPHVPSLHRRRRRPCGTARARPRTPPHPAPDPKHNRRSPRAGTTSAPRGCRFPPRPNPPFCGRFPGWGSAPQHFPIHPGLSPLLSPSWGDAGGSRDPHFSPLLHCCTGPNPPSKARLCPAGQEGK